MEKEATLVRAQVLMTREQRSRIERLAEKEGRSLSDITRRALDEGLDRLEGNTDDAVRKGLQALARLRAIREEMRATYGVYQGDLIAEVREERDRQMDAVWNQE
jgi:predicted transcriptional regulator